MKIGIVKPTFYPYPGGVTEHVFHSYLEMKARGHDVRIVTTSFGPDESPAEGDVVRRESCRVNRFIEGNVNVIERVVIGPDIRDLAGNLMNQNQDATNGDPAVDVYNATLRYIDADAIFTSSRVIIESDTTFDGSDILGKLSIQPKLITPAPY